MEQVTGFINEILLSWGFSQSWADDLTSGIILNSERFRLTV